MLFPLEVSPDTSSLLRSNKATKRRTPTGIVKNQNVITKRIGKRHTKPSKLVAYSKALITKCGVNTNNGR